MYVAYTCSNALPTRLTAPEHTYCSYGAAPALWPPAMQQQRNLMRKSSPFSPSSKPPIKPGRSRYLRGMLRALSPSPAPLGGLVPTL